MPWTGASFKKHNASLSSEEAKDAARIANDVLRRTGDEGRAIASANAVIKTRRSGQGMSRRTHRPRFNRG